MNNYISTTTEAHRKEICKKYKLDYSKQIGVNLKTGEIKNIDFSKRGSQTIPQYIEQLFGKDSSKNFVNYDAVFEFDIPEKRQTNKMKELRKMLLSL